MKDESLKRSKEHLARSEVAALLGEAVTHTILGDDLETIVNGAPDLDPARAREKAATAGASIDWGRPSSTLGASAAGCSKR